MNKTVLQSWFMPGRPVWYCLLPPVRKKMKSLGSWNNFRLAVRQLVVQRAEAGLSHGDGLVFEGNLTFEQFQTTECGRGRGPYQTPISNARVTEDTHLTPLGTDQTFLQVLGTPLTIGLTDNTAGISEAFISTSEEEIAIFFLAPGRIRSVFAAPTEEGEMSGTVGTESGAFLFRADWTVSGRDFRLHFRAD